MKSHFQGKTCRITLGLDMDNTITKHPDFFAQLTLALKNKGGEVFVVSSRANNPEVQNATEVELVRWNIVYDKVSLIPDSPDERIPCPHDDVLDGYQAYLWQKVKICQDLSVTVYFDDDAKVVELFRKYAPDIQVFRAL